jgi:hypothetical protein
VHHLKALQTIAILDLPSRHVQHTINQLRSFCVLSTCPIIAGTTATDDKAIGIEKAAIRTAFELIEGTRFEIAKDGTWDENFFRSGLIVDIEALIRKNAVAVKVAAAVDVVLLGNNFPKLRKKNIKKFRKIF